MIRQKISKALLIIWCLAFFTSPATAAETTAVAVNQSRILNYSGVERVAIANPEIADVIVVSGSEVLLIGKAPGLTTLHVWSSQGRSSLLVEVASDNVKIAADMKNILGYPDVRISKVNQTMILEGTVNDQYQKNRAEKVAAAYGDKVVNLLEITRPVQVKIEAKIVEINREKTKNIGIAWGNNGVGVAPGNFSFGQSYTNSFLNGSALGGLGNYAAINAQLSALVKDGSARILSQPSLITLSGEKANIMVGGQIPIPVSLSNGTITIEWKDYGIKLDIAPEVNAEGLINSAIKAEVSSLDWNSTHKIKLGSNIEIPPIKMRKAETAIALSSGQTMAIGGLIATETLKDVIKLPLLGDLPVIGNLFKSTSFTHGETELIIFITPTIVNPAEYLPAGTSEMKAFIQENPWGGTSDGGKDKNSSR